jgi:hypothetical protein
MTMRYQAKGPSTPLRRIHTDNFMVRGRRRRGLLCEGRSGSDRERESRATAFPRKGTGAIERSEPNWERAGTGPVVVATDSRSHWGWSNEPVATYAA